VYERLTRALDDLHQHHGGLPNPKQAAAIWDDMWHQEAHHSTALEGNTLVLREVRALLDEGRAVGAKPLAEYNEVRGYADAAHWVYAQALEPDAWHDGRLLTMSEVRHVHHMAMTPVWDVLSHPGTSEREGPGNFREHDIHEFPGGMKPPSWPLVTAQLEHWLEEVCVLRGRPTDRPVPEDLARLHAEFERIHPFIDGNGRTGRLLLNLILVRLGFPPIVILKRQRDRYLTALRRADNGDHGQLGELFARAMIDNVNQFILPTLAGPDQYAPLAALTEAGLSLAALRQAAQRGRLDAVQGTDGMWRSSRAAVERYRASRQRGS
jgi:Fic family protein